MRLDLAGHATPVRVWDRGGPRPVVALHCSLAHAGAWSRLAGLVSGVTVTALDEPGHGGSDWDGTTEIHGLTTRVAIALAEQLGAGEPVDLWGHSFGGTVALRLALERPDLVRSLVLVEPVLFAAARASGDPAWGPFAAAHLAFAAMVREGRRDEAAAAFHGLWGAGEALDDLPERARRYIVERIHIIPAQNAALMEDAAGLLAHMRLESLGVPVLLAEGGASPPVIAAIQGELARRLPQATRIVVPGAGHMLPLTHAEALAPAVQAHLDAS
jgi:pimeloyl-ACP methyl ester carboxylesterase